MNGNALRGNLSGAVNGLVTPLLRDPTPVVSALHMTDNQKSLDISAIFQFTPEAIKSFTLTDPPRYIIDLYRQGQSATAGMKRKQLSKVQQNTGIQRRLPMDDQETGSPGVSSPNASPPSTQIAPGPSSADVAVHLSAVPVKSNGNPPPDFKRDQLKQRLMIALIVVTSILVILLFLLYGLEIATVTDQKRPVVGKRRKQKTQQWKDLARGARLLRSQVQGWRVRSRFASSEKQLSR
jgi:hypothetical protein